MKFQGMVTSKWPHIQTTIFTLMSQLAQRHKAINLAQGFPDFPPHPSVNEAVTSALKKGSFQYAPMAGDMLLRERLSEKTENLYGLSVNPETEITITAGGTQGIFTAIQALIREGDEVLLFAPCYDSYIPAIEAAGGKYVYYTMTAPNYIIDWEIVKKLISNRTKMIILNTPHNPTGMIFSEDDMKQLAKIVSQTNIIILSDEVYEHIVFDGFIHQSVLRFPELADRSIVCSSFGKTYHVTGWKTGYVIAPDELMKEFRKVHQFNVFSVNSLMQSAFAELLLNKDLYLELATFYQAKRDLMLKEFQNPKFEALSCSGTYFQLYSYKKFTEEKDTEFVKRLIEDFGIATIPVSVFYPNQLDEKIIRFCFAKTEETILDAAERFNSI